MSGSKLETIHAAQTKQKVDREYDLCFSMCRMLMQMSPENLKSTGHKTIEDGIVYSVKETIKKTDALWKEHLKMFPDE